MILFGTSKGFTGGIERVCGHIRRVMKEHDIPFREITYNSGGNRLARAGSGLRFAVNLRKHAGRSDLLLFSHLHLLRALPAGKKAPVAVMIHGIELDDTPARTRKLLNKADCIICNSHHTAGRVRQFEPRGEIHQMYYPGLSEENFPDITRQEAEHPVVLSAGRMAGSERYKGHRELLRAWPEVLTGHPDARLVFAGSGDDVTALKKLAEELEISDSVTFALNPTDRELAGWYAQSWLKAMPSSREGQGLVFTEALSRNVPVLALAGTVAEEFITHRQEGLLCGSTGPNELAAAIDFALSDSQWRRTASLQAGATFRKMEIKANFDQKIPAILKREVSCAE